MNRTRKKDDIIKFTYDDPENFHRGPIVEGWPPTRSRFDILKKLSVWIIFALLGILKTIFILRKK